MAVCAPRAARVMPLPQARKGFVWPCGIAAATTATNCHFLRVQLFDFIASAATTASHKRGEPVAATTRGEPVALPVAHLIYAKNYVFYVK